MNRAVVALTGAALAAGLTAGAAQAMDTLALPSLVYKTGPYAPGGAKVAGA